MTRLSLSNPGSWLDHRDCRECSRTWDVVESRWPDQHFGAREESWTHFVSCEEHKAYDALYKTQEEPS